MNEHIEDERIEQMHAKIGARLLTVALTTVALTLAGSADAAAQLSLEGRAGVPIPMGELVEEGLDQTAGLAFAGAALYTFRDNLSAYFEGSWQQFNCDGCETDVESWGFDGGLKYVLAASGTALPWVRAGVTLQQVSVGDSEGEWGLGLDSGIGIDWLLTERFALVPALRFDVYGVDDLTVRYLTIDLGAHWHLY